MKVNITPFQKILKRLIDILISIPLIIILTFYLPIFALIVKYKSPGPLFYTQQRGGYRGKKFKIYKLRTLHHQYCDEGQQQVIHKDKRISSCGKWLRHFSIDELPQLYNVLIGDMSLIGPRPHASHMDSYYHDKIQNYNNRYLMKPGITGLAQITGHRGETKTIQQMEERILSDTDYISKYSLMLDIMILFKTIRIIFRVSC